MNEHHYIIEERDSVVIRFAGDSGDGMQLTGTQFTNTSAVFGNDVSTMPDFPAEIRAPVGTLAGVSGFQVNFSNRDILTPGDAAQILVAMNPAALKASLSDVETHGTIIINTDAFSQANLRKAGYESDPRHDDSLKEYKIIEVPLTSLNREALKGIEGLSTKEKDRSQNFFALGLAFWMFDRSLDVTVDWINKKFAKTPAVREGNIRALETGYNFGDTSRIFQQRYRIRPASLPPGTYRKVTGNNALAMGFVTAARKMGKPLFYGTYPITPASDILHALAPLRNFDVRTFQAEDEIAAMGSVIGAAFGGALAVTGTSGPGVALKSEGMNLAVALELPMIIVNVQRGGPSTGLPTKVEQSDLLQAMFGRNGEAPVPIVAPQSPADCYDIALEAARIATTYRTPVFILSDGYLANGSEPWRIPDTHELPDLTVTFATEANYTRPDGSRTFMPFVRDPETLARPWAVPGTPELENRIGGIEKADITGHISYDPDNHDKMVRLRQAKVDGIANTIGDLEVEDPSGDAKVLVIGWGSTYGPIGAAAKTLRREGHQVAQAHLRHLNPFPANTGDVLKRYDRVIVPEMNLGQLALLLRGRYLVDAISYNQVRGMPFKSDELATVIKDVIASV